MPKKSGIVEHVQLDQEWRWKYLRRLYEVASRFYQAEDRVVREEEDGLGGIEVSTG